MKKRTTQEKVAIIDRRIERLQAERKKLAAPHAPAYRAAAERLYADDDCFFDRDAEVDEIGDYDGAWVSGWLWVNAKELP